MEKTRLNTSLRWLSKGKSIRARNPKKIGSCLPFPPPSAGRVCSGQAVPVRVLIPPLQQAPEMPTGPSNQLWPHMGASAGPRSSSGKTQVEEKPHIQTKDDKRGRTTIPNHHPASTEVTQSQRRYKQPCAQQLVLQGWDTAWKYVINRQSPFGSSRQRWHLEEGAEGSQKKRQLLESKQS